MRRDQKMGEGNYPLAGHHLKQKNLLFGPLENIKTGAQIVITDFKKDYIYSVTSKDIISEMDADVVEETNKKEITLITCDKAVKTEGRLVVKGELVDSFGHICKSESTKRKAAVQNGSFFGLVKKSV